MVDAYLWVIVNLYYTGYCTALFCLCDLQSKDNHLVCRLMNSSDPAYVYAPMSFLNLHAFFAALQQNTKWTFCLCVVHCFFFLEQWLLAFVILGK